MKVVIHFYTLLLFENMAKPVLTAFVSKIIPSADASEKPDICTGNFRHGKINHLPRWPDRPKYQYYERTNR